MREVRREACGQLDCRAGAGGREVPQAVSLIFRFVFEQIDGCAEVRLD